MKQLLSLLTLVFLIISCKEISEEKLYPGTFPLSDVQLLDSPFRHAQELNLVTLMKYDPNRFLAPFRKVAGLEPKAENYPNWESGGLDGHVGGHYLSAMAIHYTSTGDEECLRRMNYMVSELNLCQDANAERYPGWGTGYVGAVPGSDSLWSGIKAGRIRLIWDYWVPWYNVHKTYEGLRDAWFYGGSEKAKDMFLKFCDWAIDLTDGLTDEQMEAMLANEHGGMNEVLADAYFITGDEKYLAAAKRFSHKDILNPMSEGIDNLDNKHANTQVPKAIGFQRIAEVSGDQRYERAGNFFWETVKGNRSLAFGGNSRSEHFPPADRYIDYLNDVQGPESCNTYNMLRLTQGLFRMDPKAEYADFYERALYNHILSTQHPEHGGYVYFTPACPRHYRVYSAPNKAMWCCVGTGMENHGKYGEFIYTHSGDSLYVNLFIASELNWRKKGLKVRQDNTFPYEESTRLTITEGRGNFSMLIRCPSWVEEGMLEIKVNGEVQPVDASPSSYFALTRNWKAGDVVEVELPMHITVEKLPNVPSYIAFLHGPVLLGARTGTEDLRGLVAGDGRWEHIAHGTRLPLDEAPMIVANDLSEIAGSLVPVAGKPMTFRVDGLIFVNSDQPVVFEPFFSIHDSRYMIYWTILTDKENPGNG